MVMTRSRSETVVFKHPFRIASAERLLPAGSYEVITEEESTEGLSFPSFRPVATMMKVPAPPPRGASVEMVTISSVDLSDAREPMRWREAPVDLGKHRDSAAPNTDFRPTPAEIGPSAEVLLGRLLHLERELLATPAKPRTSVLPELKMPGRDLRIDACRGIALWCIFLNHIPNNIGSWLTLRNYGFSDSAEVFMFASGVTCAIAYGKAHERGGWMGVLGRTLQRSWDIYAAFLLLILACAVVVYLAGGGGLADETNTRILLEHPGATLAQAAILQYRPVNTDVLPLFVIFHLLFAPLLWLMLRVPNVALGASLLLYASVHLFGWTVPAWPNNDWFFNPLAWQLLVVLGAWCVTEGKKFWPRLSSRLALGLAVLYLGFSLTIALGWSIRPPEVLVPQILTKLPYLAGKSDLDPLRLLHFIALAILVVWLVPRNWRGLSTPAMRGAIRCGENPLAIYCLGVLLALAGHIALVKISDELAMQIALSFVGILVMIATATLLSSIRTKPRQRQPLMTSDFIAEDARRNASPVRPTNR
ncbi:OpgC domain-containing protein [Bradyrhizobium sp. 1(2017)]|uniref:OpgC domain-containing protein n=1 Tax=Bradyrhizobium sp. 1(2017) TaxID=1404888 RepID=UPI00140EFB93|nr:OpgC domain-containing protein [Bradyrhizobium sp. 1(2017)]QIO31345.1 OpgC domain-containing protein [Bradyrhizobium sp. 1(2017)]